MRQIDGFIFLVLVSVLFYAVPVQAGIVINEIMYDLDGGDVDWIEVYNPDSTEIDLTSLKLLVDNSDSNHTVSKYSDSAALSPGGYVLIVPSADVSDYVNKWGSVGNIFTASFSLPNDNAKVEINAGDKNTPVVSESYTSSLGASGDGKSLQKVSGSWVAAVPTPGAINAGATENKTNTNTGTNTTTSTSGGSSTTTTQTPVAPKPKTSEPPKMSAEIISKTVFPARVKAVFDASVLGYNQEKLIRGKFIWNFGDGETLEESESKKVEHIYYYPGEYVVTFDYYGYYYSADPEVSDRQTVKVISPDIIISSVGSGTDTFVEISNKTKYESDLSGWVLVSSGKQYTIPKRTFILPEKSIILSSRVTKFSEADKIFKLSYPSGELAFEYPATAVAVVPILPTDPLSQISLETSLQKNFADSAPVPEKSNAVYAGTLNKTPAQKEIKDENIISGNAELTASPLNALSDISSQDPKKKNNNMVWFYVFGAVVAVACIGGLTLRRAKLGRGSAEVESAEHGVKAEDFKIME